MLNKKKKFLKNKKNAVMDKSQGNEKNPKPKEDDEIKKLQEQYDDSINPQEIKSFTDLPLSWRTLKGLKACNYKIPTDIQKESIGYALRGKDILGAAITGSGKTLAFIIPILENLYAKKWSRMDGVGAIIISPTRELAYQIFETLKKVGAHHEFSAGLIIGGKNLKFERTRMDQCNIVICTPGRLLQHMDENPLFNASSMNVLVLDEADRCLDMGFADTMNGIIENLPAERQTWLFSATQTKSVKDLARLSLINPVYVAPHEQQQTTPSSLQQNYVVINLEDKITMIWSFIKNHFKQKCIVFLSTCKQVKYIYEIFCKLRPGTSLLALYGSLHQDRRVAIYNDFCRKSNVVLFATDIASRGLDFPVVNWVIQLDCPEDVTQYIHRAGRTARHNARGESLLVLLPSEEEAMVQALEEKKIPINKIEIDPKKLFSPKAKMEAFLAQSKDLKDSAQRAFIAYFKSIVLMKNKKIFNVDKLNTDDFAKSLGLVVPPRLRFLDRLRKRKGMKKPVNNDEESSSENEETKDDDDGDGDSNKKSKSNHIHFQTGDSSSDEAADDLIKIKRKNHEIEDDIGDVSDNVKRKPTKENKNKVVTKAALAKRVLKNKIVPNKKVIYNEDGEEIMDPQRHLQSEFAREYLKHKQDDDDDAGGIDIETAKKILHEEDKFDKKRFREIVKAKRKDKKKKIKKTKKDDEDQQFDDFGSDDDEESVDLSWLPDPDKIYGKKLSNSEDNESINDDDVGSENEIHKPPKKLYEKSSRKHKLKQIEVAEFSEESDSNDGEPISKKHKTIASKLSVEEAEMLAMELLGK